MCIQVCNKCCFCGKGESHRVNFLKSAGCCRRKKNKTKKKHKLPVVDSRRVSLLFSNVCHLHHFIRMTLALSAPNPQDSDLLLITVLDENDNRPVFTRTGYTAEIKENSAAGITRRSSLEYARGVLQLYRRALLLRHRDAVSTTS